MSIVVRSSPLAPPAAPYFTQDADGITHPYWPVLHMLPSGNYISCNQYWSIGMLCPHCESDDE